MLCHKQSKLFGRMGVTRHRKLLIENRSRAGHNYKQSSNTTVLCIFNEKIIRILVYIYNGNIFPSLNPAKIFQFISRWTGSTKSLAVGLNHHAVINTSNEVKSPLLWEFWIYIFSLRILERVLRWKHCKYKEWVSFFWVHGEWIVARNKQIGRELLRGSRDLFVPRYDSFPMNPEKKTLIP